MRLHAGAARTHVREAVLETDSGREKNPLPHLGLEPVSVLRLAFQSDTVPAEIFPPRTVGRKSLGNLVFYAQSTSTVISGRLDGRQ